MIFLTRDFSQIFFDNTNKLLSRLSKDENENCHVLVVECIPRYRLRQHEKRLLREQRVLRQKISLLQKSRLQRRSMC
jgi:hypothetical protein